MDEKRRKLVYPHTSALPQLDKILREVPLSEIESELSIETREAIYQNHLPEHRLNFRHFNLKIDTYGKICLYGLTQKPFSLHKDQWIRLYHVMEDVITFIKINDPYLSTKHSLLRYDIPEKNTHD